MTEAKAILLVAVGAYVAVACAFAAALFFVRVLTGWRREED